MKATYTIVIREPEKTIAEEYRKLLLEAHPTAFGYAAATGEQVENGIFDGTEYDLSKALSEVEENYPKARVCYSFVNANDQVLDEDSLQPFNAITTGEGKDATTQLSVMVEGEFPDYEDKDENYSTEYHVMKDGIAPLIKELQDIQPDAAKICEALDKPSQEPKITKLMGGRANILFIPAKGKLVAKTKNKEQGSYDWGFTTRRLGYTGTQVEAKKEDSKSDKPLTMAERKAQRAAAAAAETHPPGGSVVPPEELYAGPLKNEMFYLRNGELWAKPQKGTKLQGAKTYWNTHSTLPRVAETDGTDWIKKLYEGFPASKLRPNSPIYELMNRLMGEAKKPKTAASEQGPEKPVKEKEQEPEKLTPMTLLLTADDKKKYLDLKEKGKIVKTTVAQINKDLADNAVASKQLAETYEDLSMISLESFSLLPDHLKCVLFSEVRSNGVDLSEPEAPAEEEVVEPEKKPLTMAERKALRAAQSA